MLGWEHSQIPSTSRAGCAPGSGGRGELVSPVPTMTGFPSSLQVLDFISLPKMW